MECPMLTVGVLAGGNASDAPYLAEQSNEETLMNLRRTFALVSFCLLSVCYVHPISAVSISDPIVVGVIHSEATVSA